MNEAKLVSTPLGSHFKLSKEQSPKTEKEMDHMSKVPYALAIGSLMYAMVCTRPDIAHAVGVVSRFMSRPGKAALGGSQVDSKISEGFIRYMFLLHRCKFEIAGLSISWASNLQKIVTLSTIEAEYVAAVEVGKEMIWLHGFLDELDKLVILEKICGSKNPADMLTKGVTIEKLKLCAASIGLLA
ncbi:Retrovirus-related Pol polyprotein from transposon TNT 1-94 [Vitis vinifera]|uniref:Retrovirus-related Pol polyprotein from transposon TNT 1-94 n=1 Tax=Vitis vinifera TaxID=29760 RepID=A0A438GQD8_VITVI|nr:Retrovirus-related Pol polyprotein from transposon TNT 1-94 [Vitis vinifera]